MKAQNIRAPRSRLERRITTYAALAGVTLAAAPGAKAEIIYSGPVNINIPSTVTGIYLNVVTGQVGMSGAVPGWDINPWSSTTLNFFTPTPNPGGGEMVGSGGTYFNLFPAGLIGPGSTFAATGTTTTNPSMPLNFNSALNIMGFRFINEAAGGQIQYGWVQISLSGTAAAQPRTILGYAYETTGAAISPPLDIPEPVSIQLLALAALGAIAIRAWRKRTAV